MRCIHINIRQAVFVLLTFLANNIQTADNSIKSFAGETKGNTNISDETKDIGKQSDTVLKCPTNTECKDLPMQCLECDLNETCVYGREMSTKCRVRSQVKCQGPNKDLTKKYLCRYCYQTEHWEHSCELKATCDSVASPRDIYITNCTVNGDVLCLGQRTFNKRVKCSWTRGCRWYTALALSITLGGLGADRFYLGHWQEGIGKLFSFGGLGVWTIIDVILISLHYLGPADGSLYL
ncbi:TM2 domain-containing protein almondex [Euwallacea similis]|uniref:TM2 domain-containing protein almondex n=1 Tax=Euwallacea similis TaxID=1736056 RepID=UPI00344B1978